MYNCEICITIPSRICNTDPAALQVQEHLEDWAEHTKSYAGMHFKQIAAFYAGQPIATFDTLRKIWIPSTGFHVIPENSYQVCTANGTIYHNTRCHLQECSVRCNDAEPRFPRPVSQPFNEYHNQLHLWPQNQILLSQCLHLQPCQRSPQCPHPPLNQV